MLKFSTQISNLLASLVPFLYFLVSRILTEKPMASREILFGRIKIPVYITEKLASSLSSVLEFRPFIDWKSRLEHHLEMSPNISLHRITISDIDYFGSRIGFVKMTVDIRFEDGSKLPGVVLLRGDAVAILLRVSTPSGKSYAVMTIQPRIPLAHLKILELPVYHFNLLTKGRYDGWRRKLRINCHQRT